MWIPILEHYTGLSQGDFIFDEWYQDPSISGCVRLARSDAYSHQYNPFVLSVRNLLDIDNIIGSVATSIILLPSHA